MNSKKAVVPIFDVGMFLAGILCLLTAGCTGHPSSRSEESSESAEAYSTISEDSLPVSRESEGGWTTGGVSAGDTPRGEAPADSDAGASVMTKRGVGESAGEPESEPKKSASREDVGAGPAESASPEKGPSGLEAGYTDDNRQYNRFLSFLEEHRGEAAHRKLPAAGRMRLEVRDAQDRSYPGVSIVLKRKGKVLDRGVTGASGIFDLYFPREEENSAEGTASYEVLLETEGSSRRLEVDPAGMRRRRVVLDSVREIPNPLPLDVLFVMDTTGSMGEEIERLRRMMEIIHLNLRSLSVPVEIRFGMVMYKDKGDEYRTRGLQLTSDLEEFQGHLKKVRASGGGDLPEDLEGALVDTLERVDWNRRGVRLAYVITDAPAHLDYEDLPYDYAGAARRAKARGIKIHTIGTGGLPLDGEYQLRQLAQYTGGRYIFLTYGEQGEAEGGQPGSVSHHTGANFQTDRLESIIINFTKEEVGYLTDQEVTLHSGYFQADPVDRESRRETLEKLTGQLLDELYDYASLDLSASVPLLVGPLEADDPVQGEFLREILQKSAADSSQFRPVERQGMTELLSELEFRHSGAVDPSAAQDLGGMTGAEAAVFGKLFPDGDYQELTVRLVRIATGEVLSVSRARIKADLLPGGQP